MLGNTELLFNQMWVVARPYLIAFIVFVIIIIILDIVKDKYYYNHGKYTLKKLHLKKRRDISVGKSSDLYAKYWLWERKKRAILMDHYLSMELSPYSRHSRKKKKDQRSLVPFRCEVFCKARN